MELTTSSMTECWKVWKYAQGSFQDETTKKYDNTICIIRTFIFSQLVITNCFIVAGNIRHWNDHYTPPNYERPELNSERRSDSEMEQGTGHLHRVSS